METHKHKPYGHLSILFGRGHLSKIFHADPRIYLAAVKYGGFEKQADGTHATSISYTQLEFCTLLSMYSITA